MRSVVVEKEDLSGDLKDPSKSIPRGTLWAVGVTFLVYVAQMTWFAMNSERAMLVENKLVMQEGLDNFRV